MVEKICDVNVDSITIFVFFFLRHDYVYVYKGRGGLLLKSSIQTQSHDFLRNIFVHIISHHHHHVFLLFTLLVCICQNVCQYFKRRYYICKQHNYFIRTVFSKGIYCNDSN